MLRQWATKTVVKNIDFTCKTALNLQQREDLFCVVTLRKETDKRFVDNRPVTCTPAQPWRAGCELLHSIVSLMIFSVLCLIGLP